MPRPPDLFTSRPDNAGRVVQSRLGTTAETGNYVQRKVLEKDEVIVFPSNITAPIKDISADIQDPSVESDVVDVGGAQNILVGWNDETGLPNGPEIFAVVYWMSFDGKVNSIEDVFSDEFPPSPEASWSLPVKTDSFIAFIGPPQDWWDDNPGVDEVTLNASINVN